MQAKFEDSPKYTETYNGVQQGQTVFYKMEKFDGMLGFKRYTELVKFDLNR